MDNIVASTPAAVPEHLSNPSLWNSVKYNYEERFTGKLNYQFGMVGRGFVTFAIFLLGLVVGRLRFFEEVDAKKKRNIFLFLGFVVASFVVNWAHGLMPAEETRVLFRPAGTYISNSLLAVKALEDIDLVLFSGALLMGFVILYQSKFGGKFLDVLSPYGRMGLTNYLMQGVIGCLILSTWAFGPTFAQWGVSELFLLGLVIYVAQIIYSKYWLNYFLYGPLEWLWRSATYLKMQPFRKTRTDQKIV